jgi:hypothetical protein
MHANHSIQLFRLSTSTSRILYFLLASAANSNSIFFCIPWSPLTETWPPNVSQGIKTIGYKSLALDSEDLQTNQSVPFLALLTAVSRI